MKVLTVIPPLVLIVCLTACGSSPTTPQAPPQSLPVVLAQFTDTDDIPGVMTRLVTPDVHDVDEQVVRFDTANGALIWAADNRSFSGYAVSGYIINHDFQGRFGSKNGVRETYFTETARPFICNIEVANGRVTITATNVPVPGGS